MSLSTRRRSEANPLVQLPYFVEWGGRGWQTLLADALQTYVGTNLEGRRVLDIGTRYGRMACLFALLGADVVGIDVHESPLRVAQSEARRWAVEGRVEFVKYGGDLDIFTGHSFDLVFTKSVLVLIHDLAPFLAQISSKLRSDGKVVFLENAKGNAVVHGLRRFRHRRWNYTRAHYFTDGQIAQIGSVFDIDKMRKTVWPPVYLVCGHKRQ